MSDAKIYLDEDVHGFIAHALRLRGWDALTKPEAGRLGNEDIDQIRFATEHGHAVLSYNVRDFARLHYEFLTQGWDHAGIIVSTQDYPRGNVRALFHLLSHVSAEDLRNELVYLANWA